MAISLNRYLDHAVLKPEMSIAEATAAIQLGIDYKVKTVCVRPWDIELAVAMCRGTETEVSCVLGFPHGTLPSALKAEEAKLYVKQGVNEIDMVVNYGLIRSSEWDRVRKDIEAVSEVTRLASVGLKVIFETSQLNQDQIALATEAAIAAQADFVKTSTGFYGEGATVEAVETMVKTAAGRIKVKASGGIRDAKTAQMFVEMGCDRLGVGYSTTPVLCGDGTAPAVQGNY